MVESPSPGLRRAAYVARVNAVVDYIERHLADDLNLETLAAVAHFSPFHFHRIFSAMVGETLGEFVQRLRVERAASLLMARPGMSITEVAQASGFASPSALAKVFRARFGVSATGWRKARLAAGAGPIETAVRALIPEADAHFGVVQTRFEPGAGMVWVIRAGSLGTSTVRIETLDSLEVAYVRRTGPYQGQAAVYDEAFTSLVTWAQARGLVSDQSVFLTIAHDNPSVTADTQHRISACLVVPPETTASGEVGRMRVDGGTYAVCRFELGELDYAQAWLALSAGWLPDSGYEPADSVPYERYDSTLHAATPGTEVVDICIPVRPARD